MRDPKTFSSTFAVSHFLASIENDQRRTDSQTLCGLMGKVTGCPPTLWGTTIIGFGSYHYRHESDREGDTVAVGFAPRKNALGLYGLHCPENDQLWPALGKYSTGKGCLYVKRLNDVNLVILEEMIKRAFAHNHP